MSDRLLAALAAHGRPWPAPIEHFETLASTSDRAKELLRSGAPEWTVVLADVQTAGRGRQGRSWYSPPGNLHLSVLLRPRLAPERAGLVPLMGGVAVAEAIASLGLDARLKWPNDVLVGGRKLAGILAEGVSAAEAVEAVVLGIGVDVALDPAAVPAELRDGLTSLHAEGRRDVDAVGVAASVLGRLAVWYDALGRREDRRILDAWRERSVAWWGEAVEVHTGGEVVNGVARGIDDHGRLLLERPDGTTVALLSGEVHSLRKS
jgi:BirA family biotin operon repressor/biotin-[acetyl-CoA-carboxylase] ligase